MKELRMKRAMTVMVLLGAMAFLLSACELSNFLTGRRPAATVTPAEAIEEMGQILTELTATAQVSSPTTISTLALVNTLTISPINTPVVSPTVAPLLVISEAPTGDAPVVTETTASAEVAAVFPTATLMAGETAVSIQAFTLTPSSAAPTLTQAQAGSAAATNTPTAAGTATPTTNSPTAAGAITQTPTSTPGASRTPIPVNVYDPSASLGEPDWSDPMDDGNNWAGGADSYTDIYFENSMMALIGVSEAVGWRVAKTEKFNNIYADLVVSSGNCAGGDAYGLIFRVPDLEVPNQGYLFTVNCEGAYALKRWNGNAGRGFWSTIINWKYTDALYDGPNQTNRLGVRAVGRSLSLYINGKWVDNIYDATYGDGYVGVFVNRYKTEKYTIYVDELSVWRKP
jgi:hypothetical protein